MSKIDWSDVKNYWICALASARIDDLRAGSGAYAGYGEYSIRARDKIDIEINFISKFIDSQTGATIFGEITGIDIRERRLEILKETALA